MLIAAAHRWFAHAGGLMLALAPLPAAAQDKPPAPSHEAVLDIDRDGRADLAAMVEDAATGRADLHIYLSAGDEALDPKRQPAIVKKDLTVERILAVEGKSNGSLVITSGCGGCSNDSEKVLTIVQRGGVLLVAGFTLSWDTRSGIGRCDVNFLTGRGVITHGLAGKPRPLRGRFAPVPLAAWSAAKEPDCGV